MPPTSPRRAAPLIFLTAMAISACSSIAVPTSTPTVAPTEITIAMVAVVNGEGIPASEYSAELERYQAAQSTLGNTISDETASQIVLNDLVDQVLLEQGAVSMGYTVDEPSLQERIEALTARVGGAQALSDWQSAHGYTEANFRSTLRRQMAVAWMRDQVAGSVPTVADQVHVKQILFYNADSAQAVWAQLQAGVDFYTLANQYDPVTQGELGWFPRDYLLEPVIEEAAFSLEPGQYSEVLESMIGYHIILVIERDPAHLLTPDARLTLQIKALQDWISQQRDQSVITMTP